MTEYIKNTLKNKLNRGKTVCGIWSMIPSEVVVEVAATSKLDFIIIDMEHNWTPYNILKNMVGISRVYDFEVVVRAANKDEDHILKILECGVTSILIPHIRNKKECEDIIKICKYYPLGNRSMSPYTINHQYSDKNLKNSIKINNDNLLLGVLVESKCYLDTIREICSVDNLDIIYTGIYDIAQDMGLNGNLYDKRIMDNHKLCTDIIKNSGKIPASIAINKEYIKILQNNGYQFISYLPDVAILKDSFEDIAKIIGGTKIE